MERDGEVMAFESAWLRKDGQVLAVRESARAVRDRDGTTLFYEGTVEDVTEQRRLEEERQRLVAAVEQASETVVIMDTDGRIEYVNPAFERTTGYTHDEAIGKKLTMLDSGEHDDEYYAALWQTITQSECWTGALRQPAQGRLAVPGGDATISPIRDENGEIINFVAVKRDVTSEMELQRSSPRRRRWRRWGGSPEASPTTSTTSSRRSSPMSSSFGADRRAASGWSPRFRRSKTSSAAAPRSPASCCIFSRRETVKPEQLDLNEQVREAGRMLRRLVKENIKLSIALAPQRLQVTADRGQTRPGVDEPCRQRLGRDA